MKQNPHYRNLTEMETELTLEVRQLEAQILEKLEEIGAMRQAQKDSLRNYGDTVEGLGIHQLNESHRCIALAKTNIQQGIMWAVRATTLPDQIKAANDD